MASGRLSVGCVRVWKIINSHLYMYNYLYFIIKTSIVSGESILLWVSVIHVLCKPWKWLGRPPTSNAELVFVER
jgi:hypothetical protein